MGSTAPTTVLLAFGRAVRNLRSARGLSQEALAERAGIHRTYVGDVERGERNVSLINIERLATALAVSLSALMATVEAELPTVGSNGGRAGSSPQS
jgi:transcriptional regulator with XRE-family HTH domain